MLLLLFQFQDYWSLVERGQGEWNLYSSKWFERLVLGSFTSSFPRAHGRAPGLNVWFFMVTLFHGDSVADSTCLDLWIRSNRCLLRWVNLVLHAQLLFFFLAQVHDDALLEDWCVSLRSASAGSRCAVKRTCRLLGLFGPRSYGRGGKGVPGTF